MSALPPRPDEGIAADPDGTGSRGESCRKVDIYIGGVFASRHGAEVRTVLGSCVAACLFDRERRVGGMNHFMLPAAPGEEEQSSRFGVHAMELLINRIMNLGGNRRRLCAKVFGGANLLGFGTLQIGTKNADFASAFLETEKIPVLASRLGGTQPLAVHFFTGSARVLVRPIERISFSRLALKEMRARERMEKTLVEDQKDDITLF